MYLQNNFRSKLKRNAAIIAPILGIVIVILIISIVWYWETSGREQYLFKEIVVLNKDVDRGTVITDDMLEVKKLESNNIFSGLVLNKEEIIGLEAKHYIPKSIQLHANYFENQMIRIPENAYIVRLPNDWVYSFPNTLRRKDEIIFCSESSEENIILKTQVAYVKDNANREVRTVDSENRLDGSSIITEISIIATPEEFQRLEQTVSLGNKLIILYEEGD